MNRFEPKITAGREAKVKFLDADYRILSQGDFVRCAVTGKPIRLSDLRYWNVERQEAYVSAEVAARRHVELKGARR